MGSSSGSQSPAPSRWGADLLLLDEPFAALDHGTRDACRSELAAFRRGLGLTVIEVTHALDEALDHADRVVVLESGTIVAEGPKGAVISRPPEGRVAQIIPVEHPG